MRYKGMPNVFGEIVESAVGVLSRYEFGCVWVAACFIKMSVNVTIYRSNSLK